MNEVCKPNISAAGRKRRKMVGYVGGAISVALIVAFAFFQVTYWWRALVFIPSAMGAVGFLQATRNTCIAHASNGTFEHEDFSTTKAADDEVAASRKVASAIKRDAILIGLASAAIAVGIAFV